MNWSWFQETLGEYSNKLVLWTKDSKKRLIFFAFLLFIFFSNFYPKINDFVKNIDFLKVIASSLNWIYTNSNSQIFISALTFVVFIVTITFIYQLIKNSKKIFDINIEKQTDLWSYYKGSGWSIIDDKYSWNKVLKLTNSTYPAILKFGNDWINYNFSFETKVSSTVPEHLRNFSFVVRARDKGNNIFFQCKPYGAITPHFVTNGLFLVDKENEINFQAEYPLDKWISVTVNVKGEEIKITMLGVSTIYKIPSMRLLLPANKIRGVMRLKEVEDLNISSETANTPNQLPSLAFDLDYEKGTVGFREFGQESALFRKIRVELLQPIYK